jgi:hypothetical protein
MTRRRWAFALVIAVIGGPIAAGMCEAICASAGKSPLPGHAHYHSCAPSATNAGTAINAVPHSCGHSPDDTVGVQQALQLLTPPALLVLDPSLFPSVEPADLAPHTRDIVDSPPGALALSAQLRV